MQCWAWFSRTYSVVPCHSQMLCNVGQGDLDFILYSYLGCAMLGRFVSWYPILNWGCKMLGIVSLNIYCGSIHFTNALQCRTSRLRLFLLHKIKLWNVGQVFLNIICRSLSFTNDVHWWATEFRLYLLRKILMRNVGQDFLEQILWFTILHKCWPMLWKEFLSLSVAVNYAVHWCAGYVSWIPILDWGCSMLGKVFLNIFCGFQFFKNVVQSWASGLTL